MEDAKLNRCEIIGLYDFEKYKTKLARQVDCYIFCPINREIFNFCKNASLNNETPSISLNNDTPSISLNNDTPSVRYVFM